MIYPAVQKVEVQQKSTTLSPRALEFVPTFVFSMLNPLTKNFQSDQENCKLSVAPAVTAVSLEVKKQTTLVDATKIVIVSEMEGEAAGRSVVGQGKVEYFLRKVEKRINKLDQKISNNTISSVNKNCKRN